jgi:hypothetical protein
MKILEGQPLCGGTTAQRPADPAGRPRPCGCAPCAAALGPAGVPPNATALADKLAARPTVGPTDRSYAAHSEKRTAHSTQHTAHTAHTAHKCSCAVLLRPARVQPWSYQLTVVFQCSNNYR